MQKKIPICFVLYIFFFFFSVFISSQCWAMDAAAAQRREEGEAPSFTPMKFKLGLEFQEISGLCPWASEDCRLQKKKLFSLREQRGSQVLWHVELDTDDIEFVTKPFSPEEGMLLDECTRTIVDSVNILQGFCKMISGRDWVNQSFSKDVSFQDWLDLLLVRFDERIKVFGEFALVRDKLIAKPEGWTPRFSPQVTIQHPLEYSIPLYFGLFGFDDPARLFPLVASFPYRKKFLEGYEQLQKDGNSRGIKELLQKYQTKISGLAFLQALTLVQMCPGKDCREEEYLEETFSQLTVFKQVDAKARLMLMSRRPFSSMVHNMHTLHGVLPDVYLTFFMGGLGNSCTLLYKANYAEQFFDLEGRPKSLVHVLCCFEEKFRSQNQKVLIELLKQGVISTAMLRHVKAQYDPREIARILNDPQEYFKYMVSSVASPAKRYRIKVESDTGGVPPALIEEEDTEVDSLSPPWFLDSTNSMGAYKDVLVPDQATYGEAIVEVRAIHNVGSWFLKKVGIPERPKGHFLKRVNENLSQDALRLFGFLSKFGQPELMEDIKVGMTYAVFKY